LLPALGIHSQHRPLAANSWGFSQGRGLNPKSPGLKLDAV
jgi:hypothetical protein